MPSSLNLADLGRRVRTIRLARQMTLGEVVSRTDFTVSWLSKLENGQLSPSLDGLVRLADVLQCGVDSLVEGLSSPPRYVVVKNGEGRTKPARGSRGGYTTEALADRWQNRSMQPVILHVSGTGNRHRPDNHGGERFLIVLEGGVKLGYGDDQIQLDTGDSIYLDAAIPHTIVPSNRGTAKLLSVSFDNANGHHPTRRGADHARATRL
jgi:transcriptional regulator with XRE-family HTH domain